MHPFVLEYRRIDVACTGILLLGFVDVCCVLLLMYSTARLSLRVCITSIVVL